ncbi:Inner membrane protein YhcB [invertebrate metagenome]|uniref:Inner membrane protein YhcB n=1 Tax=invertebrate metagenome TaxID=1711999 RepID=A0A2H9TCN7_9ZZZZ
MLWIIATLAFVAGFVIGALVYYLFAGSHHRNGKLTRQLTLVEDEYRDYQQKVADHFTTTAHLLNKLTHTYKDIHEHMANGADSLCHDNDDVKNRLGDALLSSNTVLAGNNKTLRRNHPAPSEQPRDYAPKKAPDEKGTLSEEFNIKHPEKKSSAAL